MIDVHTHVVPAALPFVTGDDAFGWLAPAGEDADLMFGERHFRRVRAASWDLARRAADMEAAGVEHQVLSALPELFAYGAPVEPAVEYCRRFNEWLAGAVAADEGRFSALGLIPMQAPDVAAGLLAEVAELGLAGVELGTNVNGLPLHDARFRGVFAEAEDLGLSVFVHSFHPCGFDNFTLSSAANAVTFPNEIGFAIAGLIVEGVLTAFPRLRICASHGGGSLCTLLPRIDAVSRLDPHLAERLGRPASEIAQQVYVDAITFSPHTLAFVERALGADKVVFGSDYPVAPYPVPGLPDPFAGSPAALAMARNASAFLGVVEGGPAPHRQIFEGLGQ